jgi:membrane-associated protease RseP (regulator of RpoE activity)
MHFLMALVLLFVLFAYYGEPLDREQAALDSEGWTLRSISVDSAAEAAGLEAGDQLISVDGVAITTFDEFAQLVEVRGGRDVEIVYERDGEILTSSAVLGERLTAEGADGIFPLIERDRIRTLDGQDVVSYAQFSELVADRIGEELQITFIDATTDEPRAFDKAVVTELIDPGDATIGFFGVSADYPREPLGIVPAARMSFTDFGDFTWQSMSALGRFFTPGSISDFISGTFDEGDEEVTSTTTAREAEARRLDESIEGENRIISIYGAARIGASATDESLEGLFTFLVFINIFVGVFNLVPLLPLDGGHVAVTMPTRPS